MHVFLIMGSLGKLTDVGDDSGYDELRLAGRLDGLLELSVVPGVHLALASDDLDVGVQVQKLVGERSVGA